MIELLIYNEDIECVSDPGGPGYSECGNEPDLKPKYITTGNISLDLSKNTVISLNKSVLDLQDISKQSGEFSYEFTLPSSDKNSKFFENFGNLNWIGSPKYKSHRASVTKEGITIFNGRFVLVSYDANNKMYKGRIYGNLGYLINKLQNSNFRDLRYLKRFYHTYEGYNMIQDSWDGTMTRSNVPSGLGECVDSNGDVVDCTPGHIINPNKEIIYPLQDYQGLGYYHNENIQDTGATKYVPFHTCIVGDEAKSSAIRTPIDGSILTPSIKMMPLIRAIFKEAGFSLNETHYHGQLWDNLYLQLPPLKNDFLNSEDQALTNCSTNTYLSFDRKLGNGNVFTQTLSNIDIGYGKIFWNSSYYVVPKDGSYTIHALYAGKKEVSNGVDMGIRVANLPKSGSSTFPITILATDTGITQTFKTTVTLGKGDRLYLASYMSNQTGNDSLDVKFDIPEHTQFIITEAPIVALDLTRSIGDYFGDMTQFELLKEFFKLSNAVISYSDSTDSNLITLEPLINKWVNNSIPQMDITDKIDRSSKFEVRPATELMPKFIEFKWTDSDDTLSASYKAITGEGYGNVRKIDTGLVYAGSSMEIKSKFYPFTTGATRLKEPRNGSYDSELVIPLHFKDVNKFDKSNQKFQLFLWDGNLRTMNTDQYRISNQEDLSYSSPISTYPMCHNMLLESKYNYKINTNTLDSNWEYSVPFSVDEVSQQTTYNNAWFDTYYKGYVDSLYEDDTIIIETSLNLTPTEFHNLNLFAPVMLDNSKYRFIKYWDYDVMGNKPVKVQLIKDNIFNNKITTIADLQLSVRDIAGGNLVDHPIGENATTFVTSTNYSSTDNLGIIMIHLPTLSPDGALVTLTFEDGVQDPMTEEISRKSEGQIVYQSEFYYVYFLTRDIYNPFDYALGVKPTNIFQVDVLNLDISTSNNIISLGIDRTIDVSGISYNTTYVNTFGNFNTLEEITASGTTDTIESKIGGNWFYLGDEPITTEIRFDSSQDMTAPINIPVNTIDHNLMLSDLVTGYIIFSNANFKLYVVSNSSTNIVIAYHLLGSATTRDDSYKVISGPTILNNNVGILASPKMNLTARYVPIRDGALASTYKIGSDYAASSLLNMNPSSSYRQFITDVLFESDEGFDWDQRGCKVTYKSLSVEKTIREWRNVIGTPYPLGDIEIESFSSNTESVYMKAYTTVPQLGETFISDIVFDITGSGQTRYTNTYDSNYNIDLTVQNVVAYYNNIYIRLDGTWDALPGAVQYRYKWGVAGGTFGSYIYTTDTYFYKSAPSDMWGVDYIFLVEAFDGTNWSPVSTYSNIVSAPSHSVPAPYLDQANKTSVRVNESSPSGGDEWWLFYGTQNPPTDDSYVNHGTMPYTLEVDSSITDYTLYVSMKIRKPFTLEWSEMSGVSSITIPGGNPSDNFSLPGGAFTVTWDGCCYIISGYVSKASIGTTIGTLNTVPDPSTNIEIEGNGGKTKVEISTSGVITIGGFLVSGGEGYTDNDFCYC